MPRLLDHEQSAVTTWGQGRGGLARLEQAGDPCIVAGLGASHLGVGVG